MAEYFEQEPDNIQNLAKRLRDLPPVPSATTKRRLVALLAGDIQRARDKGYTLKEIVGHLKSEGLDFNYDSVRRALPRQAKSRSGKNRPSGRGAGAHRATSGRPIGPAPDAHRTTSGPAPDAHRTTSGRASDADRTASGPAPDAHRTASGPAPDDGRTRIGIARMRANAASDESGRDPIPPGAFVRRPDLKDL